MKKEAREGYKMTELGEIPNEWSIKKIGDLIHYMKSGLSRNLKEDDIGIPCIRSNNIINSKICGDELKYWYLEDDKGANIRDYILNDGDILINFINSMSQIGKGCIYKDIGRPAIYTTNIFRMQMEKKVMNNLYFNYFIQTEFYKKEIVLITKPAINQASFTTGDFKNIKLVVPTIKEQEKIVEILSTVDEQIENTEKLIQKNQELKKGLMQQLLTKGIGHTEFKKTEVGEIPKEWEVKKLDEIVEKERKITYGIVQPGEYTENGVHVIRAKDYSFGWVDNDEIFKTSDIIEKSYTRSRVKTGDLLLTIVGSVGNLAIVPLRLNEANITQQTARIAIDNNIYNSKFYYYYLESEKAKKEINKYLKSGVQPSLNLSDVNKFKIVVPLLEEQKKISRILSGLDEKLEEYKNKKEKLKEVKIGLIQQLLVGRIRVS